MEGIEWQSRTCWDEKMYITCKSSVGSEIRLADLDWHTSQDRSVVKYDLECREISPENYSYPGQLQKVVQPDELRLVRLTFRYKPVPCTLVSTWKVSQWLRNFFTWHCSPRRTLQSKCELTLGARTTYWKTLCVKA